VPGTAATVKEGIELGAYGVGETAAGEGGEFVSDVGTAAQESVDEIVDYAQERPAEVAGLGVGSLVGSAAIMGGAARVSSTAGRATRYAIQPGEELLTETGTRALSTTATGQRALEAIPGGKLDWEEPLVAGGRRAAGAAREATGDLARRIRLEATAARFKAAELRARGGEARFGTDTELGERVQDFLSDERGMAQMQVQRAKQPELETETESEVRQQAEREREQALGRTEMAQETEIETNYERTQAELDVQRPGQEIDVMPDVRGEVATEPMALERAEMGIDTAIKPDTELFTETATETGVETGVETDVETEVGVETEVETMTRMEQEIETTLEMEQETEQETEMFRPQEDRRARGMDDTPLGSVDTDVFKNIDQDLQDLAEDY